MLLESENEKKNRKTVCWSSLLRKQISHNTIYGLWIRIVCGWAVIECTYELNGKKFTSVLFVY
jgi:hypothetical protein